MRVLLVLAALLAAPVQAQVSTQYEAVLSLVPPEDALTLSATLASAEGRIDLTGDPTLILDAEGVPVEYAVTEAPAWLTVAISPASDVIPLAFSGPSVTGSRTFSVSMSARNPGEGDVGKVVITATVRPQGLGASPKAVAAEMSVSFYLSPDEVWEESRRIATEDGPPVSQSPASAPQAGPPGAAPRGLASPALWIGAFALAGAAAGVVLARRGRR